MAISSMSPLEFLNTTRRHLFEVSHSQEKTFKETANGWLGHKAVSVIAFPANIITIGACAIAGAASICTLGALKVFIFAATLGNYKPTFSTGCQYLGEVIANSTIEVFTNAFELLYDTGLALYQTTKVIKWLGKTLHLENFVQEAFHAIGRFFNFLSNRVNNAIINSIKTENRYASIKFSHPLNKLTRDHRLDFSEERRSWKSIILHTGLSIPNIPINILASTCLGIAAGILSAAFVGKVILNAVTGIDLRIPTYAGKAISLSFFAGWEATKDSANVIEDGFISVYKVADALRITKVAVKVLEVISYIPEAIFS